MHNEKHFSLETADEIVAEAIRLEKHLMHYYERAAEEAGPDVRTLMVHFCAQQSQRVIQLEQLLKEIGDLRELSTPIAD